MAVTEQVSAEATIEAAGGTDRLSDASGGGKLHLLYFKHTQSGAGDANSLVDLRKLPAGRVRVIGPLSKITCSAFGSSRTLDVGFTAYTDEDGDAVSAVVDEFLDGGDVSAAATLSMAGYSLLDSKAGVMVQAKVLGGTIPDAATLEGVIAYCIG